MVITRKAEAGDYSDIFSLMKENMSQMQADLGLGWDDNKIKNHYRQKSNIVVTANGGLVGFVAYDFFDEGAFIHSLQIQRQHQNLFLGYKLLKCVAQEVISQKKSFIRCCVFENNAAKEMYERIGFQGISRENRVITAQLDLSRMRKGLLRKLKT